MKKHKKHKKKRNPVAKEMLSNPAFKEKIVPDKKKKLLEKELDKEKDE